MATESPLATHDLWSPFRQFLGSWHGDGSGKPGTSSVDRSYSLILQDRFIEMRSRSVYPPQDGNPSGEVHEDLGLLSFDEARSCYVLREFHVEGYVNQYVLQPPGHETSSLIFITEAIENIPLGWRARITLEVTSDDTFVETFDLAGPNKEWTCHITNHFRRTGGPGTIPAG